jgi:Mitochondrial carrier protein
MLRIISHLFICGCTSFSVAFVLPQISSQRHFYDIQKLRFEPEDNNNEGNLLNIHHHDITDDKMKVFAYEIRRRRLVQSLLSLAILNPIFPESSLAGKPKIDESGQLFSPKAEMFSGGSALTRGITLDGKKRPMKLQPGQTVQNVYETRFLAYITRFLLNFDPSARTWWVNQGLEMDSWDSREGGNDAIQQSKLREEKFAEFAESVEVGLANYFVGPYGSYASVEAAKAGLIASQPEKSSRPEELKIWEKFIRQKPEPIITAISEDLSKQGILNLYALLKARYITKVAKRQLAILFSLISRPALQPVDEIRSIIGEADNATITKVSMLTLPKIEREAESRTSSRRGGGYSIYDPPTILVETPPALGDVYSQAKVEAVLSPTTRVLKIHVVDGGDGYMVAPVVKIMQTGATIRCEACAIIDRYGHIESIIVLNPGFGYGQRKTITPPKVIIEAPKQLMDFRPARAVAELEYEIVGLNIINGGNGYVADEFPGITISPPKEDPDWYVPETTYKVTDLNEVLAQSYVTAVVTEMRLDDGRSVDKTFRGNEVTSGMIARLMRDPLELLPSSIRPQLVDSLYGLSYKIPSLVTASSGTIASPRYRAVDPIFGPIGRVPVTKGALELSPSEYSRLALSGALCTVIVRTALNPLELVKTKIQLENDEEVMQFALSKAKHKTQRNATSSDGYILTSEAIAKNESIGTLELMNSLIELRGVKSLFQSSDITFLASLVFGSLGFGATELFRRSFTLSFFSNGNGDENDVEIVLLTAAALACVVTSAAATPFEVLRVKSMGLVEPKSWLHVLDSYLEEKNGSKLGGTNFTLKSLLPLWSGFFPTVSRELPFAVTKFLVFDLLAREFTDLVNSQLDDGAIPIQVGVGALGLTISAISGAFAGVAGAIISHPADLILTLTSTSSDKQNVDWKVVVKELLSREGGILNLFIGLPARSVFFFLVIGLQFFLYDYVKNIFEVGSDDLSLVLDVFYAVRQGFLDMGP